MSNLPLKPAVIHNDDNDEQINPTNNKLSSLNSRITSRRIMKRQQHIETKIANNQACDEIHDLQPKYSAIKKTNNDNSYIKISKQNFPLKSTNSHELMQGNYYDRTRFDIDYSSSSSNHQSEREQIDISVEDYKDYKKKCTPVSTSENSSNKDRSNSPPFGDTIESIQQNIAQRAGRLLELNKNQHYHKNSMKNNNKSHEQTTINYVSNDNDNKERSLSPSISSDCSTDDSSTSNKCQDDNEKTNIPYEKLLNDEDDDEELIEQPKKPVTESSTLLNKTLSHTYGTQSTTNERNKYVSNNGYNSHGSSITTKSLSDNSGSIRTNSGSDNDEESDEEHYNNSTLSNNPSSMSIYSQTNDPSIKSLRNKKSNDNQYSYSNEQNSYQLRRSNTTRSEQIGNNDEHHLLVPRLKQLPIDDPNGNNNKLNSSTDHNPLSYKSKRSLQQSSSNETNTLLSSSQQNRNQLEQQQQQHSNLSRNNSRQHQIRTTKKRKQSQLQDIIRTELIPGHRGDRDVDELVMFIDGNTSKQAQNSVPLHSTNTNKTRLSSKINSLNDSNSNKTSSRKKSRKLVKSTNDDDENITSNYSTPINQDNQTTTITHSIIDITNQSLLEHQNKSMESHSTTIDVNSTNTINGKSSLPDWFEQTCNTSLQNNEYSSSSITNHLNSEIISEPFVTVTHRRRLIKERRQDNNNNNTVSRSSRFPPPSSSSNTNDKRRVPSTLQNGIIRPTVQTKSINSSITKEENNKNSNPSESASIPSSSIVNPIAEQSLEKQESSPRLSSHSSSSSISSLLKRQSKAPPVVFLNKSIDIELNDVSFGFDLDSTPLNKLPIIEQDIDNITNTSISSSIEPVQSDEMSTQKSTQKFQQRNNRGPQFYSGSDIRPQHHRTYPSQPTQQSSYIDPLLLLQYNQQRLANYSQQLAYMNLLRTQYVSPQSQYIFLPTTYPTTTTNETDLDDETNQTSTDQIQEPLFVYATPTGQIYFQQSTTKKPYTDSEQATVPIPTVYTTPPTIYPSHYFYPSQVQHLIPSQTAYFEPIISPPLLTDTKSEQNDIDDDDDDDDENSTKLYHQIRQQSSSDIMSNALQLVYSQQRRNAQTDRFNLDDLTAYLAMKWTDTVDHYAQGDSRILLVDDQ